MRGRRKHSKSEYPLSGRQKLQSARACMSIIFALSLAVSLGDTEGPMTERIPKQEMKHLLLPGLTTPAFHWCCQGPGGLIKSPTAHILPLKTIHPKTSHRQRSLLHLRHTLFQFVPKHASGCLLCIKLWAMWRIKVTKGQKYRSPCVSTHSGQSFKLSVWSCFSCSGNACLH